MTDCMNRYYRTPNVECALNPRNMGVGAVAEELEPQIHKGKADGGLTRENTNAKARRSEDAKKKIQGLLRAFSPSRLRVRIWNRIIARGCLGVIPILISGCLAEPPLVLAPLASPSAIQVEATAVFPVPIVELRGSSADIGRQHAEQLSASIHDLFNRYLLVFIGSPMKRIVALSAADMFESELRPEHREELHSLAINAKIDERETMLGQCFLDLAQLSACSTIALPADASPDHVARFGRNLDFWSLNVADKYTTVFIVHPDDGRYAYVAIGWPGMIGVLSGMNEDGLCLASMEVPRSPRLPTAMPYTLLYRTVLERCKNVPEAVAFLKTAPKQTANNLMLMDSSGDRAVVEITPDAIEVRWGKVGTALMSTNHQRNQDADTPGLCDRYDYLHDQSKTEFGQIDESKVQSYLSHVGSHGTLQSMVFEPANRVLYLATGHNAADKTFHRLDLTPYFTRSKSP